VHCLPILDYEQGKTGKGEGELYSEGEYFVEHEGVVGRKKDTEWTEVILATTFLVIIILLFIA
jgi:hypothetical protein